jgi:hypothetical protein
VAIVGALVILHWSRGLLAETAGVLLDRVPDQRCATNSSARIEGAGDVTVTTGTCGRSAPAAMPPSSPPPALPASEIRRRSATTPHRPSDRGVRVKRNSGPAAAAPCSSSLAAAAILWLMGRPPLTYRAA